ncbi:MAG TPA: beta-galactosidase GalA [Steroidobacteraceae bacterium]|nr:beta-galactosidase GalA [Steroidobacteraceae bacterium]
MSEITRRDLLRTGLALSAGSVLANRSEALVPAALAGDSADPTVSATFTESPADSSPRERLLFDFGWKFHLGSGLPALRDLGSADGLDAFSKTGGFAFATATCDDSDWRMLDLPHDWAIELPFFQDENLQSHGYKPLGRDYPETSIGWYRRTFEVAAADTNRRTVLEFDGVFRSAMVFMNGCYLGRNDAGYVPFQLDVTDFLNYGGSNCVVIRVDATYGEGWFYEGAGIYRHVWLTKTDRLHLGRWDSTVRYQMRGGGAEMALDTQVLNEGRHTESARVRWQILDADGRQVATSLTPEQSIRPGEGAAFTTHATLPSPALWSPESPHLYSAVVTVESSGRARDAERLSFGVRTVEFDADRGLLLNGHPVKIKGTCNHQDHAGVGSALPDGLQEYRAKVLRSMGSNAVRTSHNMPAPEWVAACDRVGLMMMAETRTMSASAEALDQLAAMIKRYRNSPSIILWSMGNEEWILQKSPLGERIVAAMVARSHELDPTRLCTAAVNGTYDEGVALALDVLGFNYNLGDIEPYRAAHPRRRLIGSETASTVATRGIYTTDPKSNRVSAYDTNHPPWAELAEEWWPFYAARGYLAGGFAWTGFDYRGEPTPYGWPSVSSQFGIVDTCGFPKDVFHYYRACWSDEPVLHVFPHWNWQDRLGEPIRVWVYSNLEEIELFLNGRSLGRQKARALGHLEWQVKYEPGVLEARGMRKGRTVVTTRRETTGEPAAIRLTPDRREIRADGEDIAIVRAEVVDGAGRHVPTANMLIHFSVSGAGRFRGVGNGDPNCQESDQRPMRSLFNGLAQLIVQAGHSPGDVIIDAHTEGSQGVKLPGARLTITAQKVNVRPAVV